ncbi:MAG: hypothetical protein JWP63_2976 [Candidatus Solibacter sp.]|nr:hypothetical protein [Candidatus Solibacter sp.]
MATTIQDELYKTFLQLQGQQATALSGVSVTLGDVLAQVQDLRSATPAPNVKKTTTSSSSSSSSGSAGSASTSQGSSLGDTLTGVASTVFKSGFGLAPLVTELFGLFGGGGSAAPPPLVKYAMPASVAFQAAESGGAMGGVDYNQAGTARVYRSAAGEAAGGGTSAAQASPQITVNVQAMDARSFLDRSSDIALAVRDAMLNMNAINDVVNEL